MRRVVAAAVLGATLAVALSAAAATPRAATTCGFDRVSGTTDQFLSSITKRSNITCAGAKLVARAAVRAVPALFCGAPDHHNGWTIRHAGSSSQALHARFTKGARRFDLSTQGSC